MKITRITQCSTVEVFVLGGRYADYNKAASRILTSIIEDIKTVAWAGGQPTEEILVYRCLDQEGKTIVEIEASNDLIIYKEDEDVPTT